jgi:hypothetical protein
MRNLFVAASVAAALMASVSANAADETTSISGKAFIDFTNKSTSNETTNGQVSGNGYGVDVTRFYVDIKHTFNDVWAADVTTDFQYSSAISATEVYIKKAYLQGSFSDAFTLRVGSADMPWIPFVEDLYGFRYFEKVMVDRTGYGTSADWGLHASGKAGNGMFNYAVSVVNGNGYKNPTRSKSMDFEGRISLVPVKGLTIGAGFRSGKLGQDVEVIGASPSLNTNTRFDAVVAYAASNFRVGVEYFDSKNGKSSEVVAATETKENGTSVWGSVNFTKDFGAFARYETVKTNKDANPTPENNFTSVGLSYAARKNVDFAFAYKQTETGTSTKLKTSEVGVWSQVKF